MSKGIPQMFLSTSGNGPGTVYLCTLAQPDQHTHPHEPQDLSALHRQSMSTTWCFLQTHFWSPEM